MSIVAYTGLPGSGKSYGVVENVVIPALKAGRLVVHNMPLDHAALTAYCKSGALTQIEKDADAATAIGLCPPGAVVVLDEVWRYWPAGMRDNTIPAEQKEFFAMHRHKVADGFSMEIVLVTQDASQIAMFIRSLIEQTFRATKLTVIGSKSRFRIDVYEGVVTGQKPPVSRKIREMYGKYKPEIYALYRSHTQSDSGKAGEEQKADDRGNMLKGWRLKFAAFALIVLVPTLLYTAFHSVMKFRDKVGGAKVDAQSVPAAHQAPGVPAVPPPPPKPQESKRWRLAGNILKDRAIAYLLDSEMGSRTIGPGSCFKADGYNITCMVDGEIVAAWTGTPPPAFNQWFAGTASASASSLNPR